MHVPAPRRAHIQKRGRSVRIGRGQKQLENQVNNLPAVVQLREMSSPQLATLDHSSATYSLPLALQGQLKSSVREAAALWRASPYTTCARTATALLLVHTLALTHRSFRLG